MKKTLVTTAGSKGFYEKRPKMFEDLVSKKAFKERLYICLMRKECTSKLCLHKKPHGKTELGRPDQPEFEKPCDCSIHECDFNKKVVCVPV